MTFLLILWFIIIFIGTCTASVHALFRQFDISFSFTWTPDWGNAFQLYPPGDVSTFEMAGHFVMFFVLACLLLTVVRNTGHVIVLTVYYAIFTEILQVFFGRGAELYDVFANVIGIFVAVGIISMYRLRLVRV